MLNLADFISLLILSLNMAYLSHLKSAILKSSVKQALATILLQMLGLTNELLTLGANLLRVVGPN